MKKLEEIKSNLPSYIFNFSEMLVIILIGIFMKVKIEMIVALIAIFIFVRQHNGKQLHYKSPIKCCISTTIFFIAFYSLTYINNAIAITIAIIAAYSVTESANTKNCFLYSNEEDKKKYREMKRYIKECEDPKILEEFENRLNKIEIAYKDRFKASNCKIYEMYFLEDAKFREIRNELKMYDNHKITEALDLIFMIFNAYMLEINEFDKLKEDKKLATS